MLGDVRAVPRHELDRGERGRDGAEVRVVPPRARERRERVGVVGLGRDGGDARAGRAP